MALEHSLNSAILAQNQDVFRNINFQALQPYLNKNDLLPRKQKQFLRPFDIVDTDRADRLYAELLESSDPDRIRRLIKSLKDCRENVDAHFEIANLFEEQLEAAMAQRRLVETDTTVHDTVPVRAAPVLGAGAALPTTETPQADSALVNNTTNVYTTGSKGSICSVKWVCGYCITVGLLLLFLAALIILALVSPAKLLPFFPAITRSGVLVEMEFNLDPQWLSSGVLQLNRDCRGSVAVIEGISCSGLNTRVSEVQSERDRIYLLPASTIEIYVPEDSMMMSSQDVWIFSTLEAYNSFQLIDDLFRETNFDCDEERNDGSVCFSTADYIGRTFRYNVTQPGLYSICHDPSFERPVYNWTFNIVQYAPLSANMQPPPRVFRVTNEQLEFTIGSNAFSFRGDTCLLLNATECVGGPFVTVELLGLTRKQGVLLFPAIVVAIVLTIIALFLVVHAVTLSKRSGR